ncbi:peptidase S24/S26A/S26B/S26C [Bisporella sp. PMI_857]|nr:peptidase S24/S26A/S26B/S26C [Bisporella sp. PMI_857]
MPISFASRPFSWLKSRFIGHPFRVATATLQACFFYHLFHEFGYTTVPVWGASMLPTFEVMGDWLIISKRYRRGRGIEVGDVVQFDPVAAPGAGVIKRVLGLEGDYVLRNSPGAKYNDMIQVILRPALAPLALIMNNVDASRDSRHFGPIPMALIRGKVIGKAFPWKERRWIVNELASDRT